MTTHNTRKRSLKLGLAVAAAGLLAVVGMTDVGEAAKRLVLPRASVGTLQLKRGAVTSHKVRNGSLKAIDFAPGQLPAGPEGPQGPQGEPGRQGPPGPSGVSGWQYLNSPRTVAANGDLSWEVFCPAGKRPLGGGASTVTRDGVYIIESAPSTDTSGQATGWAVTVGNTNNSAITAFGWVICAQVS